MYWINNGSEVIGNTFNITVNISAFSDGQIYQCIVFIDHNGQELIISYAGKRIIIITTIKNQDSGLEDYKVILIATAVVLGCPCCCFYCLCCLMCFTICENETICRDKSYRRFNITQADEGMENQSSENTNCPSVTHPMAVTVNQESALVEDYPLQLAETNVETVTDLDNLTDSHIPCCESLITDNELTPSPCSGPVIDPHNTQNYLPKWFTPVSSHLKCTHNRITYYDKINDFGLEIPEGAIPRGKTISIDIGVALYGPFQFPPGMRPVSPVFWVCVRQTNFSHFLKPIIITLPHFLSLEHDEDIQSVGLTFMKAQHEMNHNQMYEFQPAEGKECFWGASDNPFFVLCASPPKTQWIQSRWPTSVLLL